MTYLKKPAGLLLWVSAFLTSCSLSQQLSTEVPLGPDFGQLEAWAAHPDKADYSDSLYSTSGALQAEARVPTFFVYPTVYFPRKGETWNADLADEAYRQKVAQTPIAYQSSVFSVVGPVYAPYYRQSAYQVYQKPQLHRTVKLASYETAYQDVKSAFLHFLQAIGPNTPFILASHSQGTDHLKRLLLDYWNDSSETNLPDRLVAAYLVGMPIDSCIAPFPPVCEEPAQTGCFVSWRTWRYGGKGSGRMDSCIAVVNPLSWTTDTTAIPARDNPGALINTQKPLLLGTAGAQISGALLYTNRPKIPGAILIRTKNYHRGDINLYYESIALNVKERVEAYLNK